MGFSRSQNVSFSSQRDNLYNPKRLMAFQKSILHLGIWCAPRQEDNKK